MVHRTQVAMAADELPDASLVRATGVRPNSPAKRSMSSAASAAILSSGLRLALPSVVLTSRPCMSHRGQTYAVRDWPRWQVRTPGRSSRRPSSRRRSYQKSCIAGKVFYQDSNHLTASYTRTFAGDFDQLLMQVIVE